MKGPRAAIVRLNAEILTDLPLLGGVRQGEVVGDLAGVGAAGAHSELQAVRGALQTRQEEKEEKGKHSHS